MTKKAVGLVLSAALLISACTSGGPVATGTAAPSTAPASAAATTAPPIKVGFVGVQSGDFAEFGKETLQGTQLALEDWNAKGGPAGRQLEIQVEDDRFDPNQAVIVTQKLIDAHVDVFIGAGASSTIIPSSLLLEGAHIVNIHAGSNPIITDRGLKYNFRASPRDDVLQPYAADWAFRQGWKTVAMLHDKTALGEGQAIQFKAAFEKLGGTVLLYEGTTSGDTDFSGVLTKVKGLNPAFLYCGCNAPQSGNIVRQAKQLGAAPQYLITDSGPTFDQVAGDARTDVYTINNLGPADIPGNEDWIARYSARWNGEKPSAFTVVYYAMSDVLFYAIDQTGGTDPEKLADFLHGLKGYKSVFGTITFDQKGDNVAAEIGIFKIPASGYPYTVAERRNDVVKP
jgi:branched-chain amino acid transport system substrate-binding protein